jgi:LysB family phage lysis regulatory protein
MNLEPVVAVTKSVSTLRAIAAAIVIAIVMGLLIAIQQIRVVSLQGNLTLERGATATALSANAESLATITTLRAEAARNETYRLDLDKRLKASEQKAVQARKDFEDLKRKSPAVRKWADQPLPDGLRGKPASTGKDNSGKARTP